MDVPEILPEVFEYRCALGHRDVPSRIGAKRAAAIRQGHEAAVEAEQQVLPLLFRKEASAEAVNAIAYATKYHSKGSGEARTNKELVGVASFL
jgi:hypothetical protein